MLKRASWHWLQLVNGVSDCFGNFPMSKSLFLTLSLTSSQKSNYKPLKCLPTPCTKHMFLLILAKKWPKCPVTQLSLNWSNFACKNYEETFKLLIRLSKCIFNQLNPIFGMSSYEHRTSQSSSLLYFSFWLGLREICVIYKSAHYSLALSSYGEHHWYKLNSFIILNCSLNSGATN